MFDSNAPDPLQQGHMLAFMYLTFAHYTDGEITDDEMSQIESKVKEWIGDDWIDAGVGDNSTLSEALDWYNSVDKDNRMDSFRQITKKWKEISNWDHHLLTLILDDLVSIAKSDGNYDDEEKRWIKFIADDMGLQDYKV